MIDKKSRLTLVKLNKADLAKGRHVLIVESPESRRAVSLNVNVFSIGRHPHNDLVISDQLTSRHHATVAWMRYTDGTDRADYSYWIIDGKGKRKRSRNGIYINGKKKSLHRLTSGDVVSIGDSIKISYNYITYSTDSTQFLNYCSEEKTAFQSSITNNRSYKDTIVIENAFADHDIPDDSSILNSTIIREHYPEDNNNTIAETIFYQSKKDQK